MCQIAHTTSERGGKKKMYTCISSAVKNFFDTEMLKKFSSFSFVILLTVFIITR